MSVCVCECGQHTIGMRTRQEGATAAAAAAATAPAVKTTTRTRTTRRQRRNVYPLCCFFFRLSQARPNFWSLHTLCYYLNAAYGHRLLATLDPLWHPRRFLLGESLLSWHLMQFVSLYVYVCVCVCVSVCFFVGVYVCGCVCVCFQLK